MSVAVLSLPRCKTSPSKTLYLAVERGTSESCLFLNTYFHYLPIHGSCSQRILHAYPRAACTAEY
eukprot:1701636-Pleurochrysis_carterae.AAC.2